MVPKRTAPVFAVSNLEASLRHYENVRGFTSDFRFGNYAGVKFGDVGLHLTETTDRVAGGSTAYFFCDEIDRLLHRHQAKRRHAQVRAKRLAIWHARIHGRRLGRKPACLWL